MRVLHPARFSHVCGCFLVVSVMMPGNLFLRRTLAWSGSCRTSFRRPAFGSNANNQHALPNALLLLRGGGNIFDNLPLGRRRRQLSTAAASSSTTQLGASSSSTTSTNTDRARIDEAAQASLSIVGSSVQPASIEDISYLHTKDCHDFRVLFVLGGPGAGTLVGYPTAIGNVMAVSIFEEGDGICVCL